MPDTVLDTEDRTVNKTDKNLYPHGSYNVVGEGEEADR